jgi:hypothetical protein
MRWHVRYRPDSVRRWALSPSLSMALPDASRRRRDAAQI